MWDQSRTLLSNKTKWVNLSAAFTNPIQSSIGYLIFHYVAGPRAVGKTHCGEAQSRTRVPCENVTFWVVCASRALAVAEKCQLLSCFRLVSSAFFFLWWAKSAMDAERHLSPPKKVNFKLNSAFCRISCWIKMCCRVNIWGLEWERFLIHLKPLIFCFCMGFSFGHIQNRQMW